MIDDLLELAEHLARRDPNRPKQASLKRAVSTAYYALFHALAFLCADQLVGWRQSYSVFTPIYRAIYHKGARELLRKIKAVPLFGPEVARIGETFLLLQERRYTADYDPEPLNFGRTETLQLVDQTRLAIEALRNLPSETKLLLAVHLIARPRRTAQ